MKKYLLTFSLLIIFPSVAFASWWNPTSWGIFSFFFHNDQQVQSISTTSTVATESSSTNVKIPISTTTSSLDQTPTSTVVTITKVIYIKEPAKVTSVESNPTPQPLSHVQAQVQASTTVVKSLATSSVPGVATSTTISGGDIGGSMPYEGGNNSWYYPNAYDPSGKLLQAPPEVIQSTTTSLDITYSSYYPLDLSSYSQNRNQYSNSQIELKNVVIERLIPITMYQTTGITIGVDPNNLNNDATAGSCTEIQNTVSQPPLVNGIIAPTPIQCKYPPTTTIDITDSVNWIKMASTLNVGDTINIYIDGTMGNNYHGLYVPKIVRIDKCQSFNQCDNGQTTVVFSNFPPTSKVVTTTNSNPLSDPKCYTSLDCVKGITDKLIAPYATTTLINMQGKNVWQSTVPTDSCSLNLDKYICKIYYINSYANSTSSTPI